MADRRDRRELNTHWFRKLLSGKPHFVIGGPDNPYLLRWFLIPRNGFFNIYLHKFLRSDDDRALHDHPWWFASLILKGGYYEHRAGRPLTALLWRASGSLAFRRPQTLHRVELERGYQSYVGRDGKRYRVYGEKPCWSLIFTGPKVREWGFACPKGWVPWTYFTSGAHGEIAKGCGEYA